MERQDDGSYAARLWAPRAAAVVLVVQSRHTAATVEVAATTHDSGWRAECPVALGVRAGDEYWWVVDGVGPLLDPSTPDVRMGPEGPRAVVRDGWPYETRGPALDAEPVVYELHVRGFARTFRGAIGRLDHLVGLGVNVIELMPVHPFDSTTNHWGYMPLVWGAVHRAYAAGGDAPVELAELVAAAHARGIHVWLDVVFNHTGEGDESMPTLGLRGTHPDAYLRRADGTPDDDAGCGNVVDPADSEIRRLVMEALGRFAALGIDGFRFDLASILTRDGGELVADIGDWAASRGIALVAEAWDLARYQVGDGFPDRRWAQWNDRFRDDGRGFLRAEPGLVAAMAGRVVGSPELFHGEAWRSINFLTAHDGLTLHDLTAVTSDRHRSWDCGPEWRLQQLKNAFCILLLSAGTPMFVMGDEFARTQQLHDNPYDIDSELTWVDWDRLDEWHELYAFVREVIARRKAHLRPNAPVAVFGTDGPPDTSPESRSLAWCVGDLYVAANMWWEELEFRIDALGSWSIDLVTAPAQLIADRLTVAPRSVVVLRR